jgi:ABC-type polysaccharide/polyol phosphate export permease
MTEEIKKIEEEEEKKVVKKSLKQKLKEKTNEKEQALKHSYEVFIERPSINPFFKLFYICRKNFQLLIRSKISALIFILGPLLIIFLVTLFFNTSALYDMNIATYSESYSSISDGIIENLSDSQYNVMKMDSEEDCLNAIKYQDFHICAIFPANMILDNSANNVVKLYVDNSRINIATLISTQISSKVNVEASELSSEIVTQILTVLDTVNTENSESKNIITNLESYNSQAQSDLSSATSSSTDIDLSYTEVSDSSISSQTSSILSGNNISSSDLSSLNTYISGLVSSYESQLASASTELTTVSSYLTSVSTGLTTEEEKISSISTNLGDIQTQIDSIKITNVDSIVSPIKTSIEPISSTNSYLLYILPSILVLLIMFVSLLISSSSIITERKSTAHFRNFINPTSYVLPFLGELITDLIIILFQSTVIMALLFYFFKDLGWQTFTFAGGIVVLTSAFFILLGMTIGYIFTTKQSTALGSISIGMILMLFSNTILPLETMSSALRTYLQYNPFVLGESILKKIFLFNATFAEVSTQIYILAGLVGLALIVAVLAMEFSKSRNLE